MITLTDSSAVNARACICQAQQASTMIAVEPSTKTHDDGSMDGSAFAADNNNGSTMTMLTSTTTKSWTNSSDGSNAPLRRHHHLASVPSSVHENMIRSHNSSRDPMRVYQVVQLLGEGSLGSVAKVRKRDRARGGSARLEFVNDEKELSDRSNSKAANQTCCWGLPLPFLRKASVHHVLTTIQQSVWVSSTSTTSPSSSIVNNSGSDYETSTSPVKNPKSPVCRSDSTLIKYGDRTEPFYALKSIHLDRCSCPEYQRELQNEVDILRTLDHPNIGKALETYHYHDRLFIVLEYCSGGDLYTRDPYTQDEAARIMRAILSAVAYLHLHNVIHRDLKYENIMFCDVSRHSTVKLIDFGLSQKFAKDEHLQDTVGTVYTMAPELLAGDYDAKADVWSCGVLAFMLLSSSLPFYGASRPKVIKRILSGKYSYSSPRWNDVDTDAKVFVRDLLERNPKQRPSAEQALKLGWLDLDEDDLNESARDMNATMDNIQAHIQAFAEYSHLKKLALMVIAYQSTNSEIGYLRNIFRVFDKTNDGAIGFAEFKATLAERYSYSDEEIDAMFKGMDIDGTGIVHYCEFLAATVESHGSIDESRYVKFSVALIPAVCHHLIDLTRNVAWRKRLIDSTPTTKAILPFRIFVTSSVQMSPKATWTILSTNRI